MTRLNEFRFSPDQLGELVEVQRIIGTNSIPRVDFDEVQRIIGTNSIPRVEFDAAVQRIIGTNSILGREELSAKISDMEELSEKYPIALRFRRVSNFIWVVYTFNPMVCADKARPWEEEKKMCVHTFSDCISHMESNRPECQAGNCYCGHTVDVNSYESIKATLFAQIIWYMALKNGPLVVNHDWYVQWSRPHGQPMLCHAPFPDRDNFVFVCMGRRQDCTYGANVLNLEDPQCDGDHDGRRFSNAHPIHRRSMLEYARRIESLRREEPANAEVLPVYSEEEDNGVIEVSVLPPHASAGIDVMRYLTNSWASIVADDDDSSSSEDEESTNADVPLVYSEEEQPSVVEEQPPTVEEQPPTVEEQPPTVEEQPSVVEEQPSVVEEPLCPRVFLERDVTESSRDDVSDLAEDIMGSMYTLGGQISFAQTNGRMNGRLVSPNVRNLITLLTDLEKLLPSNDNG